MIAVNPIGTVRALALSRAAIAVLVEQASGALVIERYRIPSGTLLASTPVSRSVSEIVSRAGGSSTEPGERSTSWMPVAPTSC